MSQAPEKKIKPREDVNPEDGIRKYGNVEFADPVNHKYPLDSAEHVRAAHRYIHQHDNAAKYSQREVQLMKERIHQAAQKHGITLSEDWGTPDQHLPVINTAMGISSRKRVIDSLILAHMHLPFL